MEPEENLLFLSSMRWGDDVALQLDRNVLGVDIK